MTASAMTARGPLPLPLPPPADPCQLMHHSPGPAAIFGGVSACGVSPGLSQRGGTHGRGASGCSGAGKRSHPCIAALAHGALGYNRHSLPQFTLPCTYNAAPCLVVHPFTVLIMLSTFSLTLAMLLARLLTLQMQALQLDLDIERQRAAAATEKVAVASGGCFMEGR